MVALPANLFLRGVGLLVMRFFNRGALWSLVVALPANLFLRGAGLLVMMFL